MGFVGFLNFCHCFWKLSAPGRLFRQIRYLMRYCTTWVRRRDFDSRIRVHMAYGVLFFVFSVIGMMFQLTFDRCENTKKRHVQSDRIFGGAILQCSTQTSLLKDKKSWKTNAWLVWIFATAKSYFKHHSTHKNYETPRSPCHVRETSIPGERYHAPKKEHRLALNETRKTCDRLNQWKWSLV